MVAARAELGAHAEPGFVFQRTRQAILIPLERAHRQIEDGELHPARDVDPDRVGNHRILGGQDAADR